jgi:RNA polymerase sigma-70 factor (ECF subfamily)
MLKPRRAAGGKTATMLAVALPFANRQSRRVDPPAVTRHRYTRPTSCMHRAPTESSCADEGSADLTLVRAALRGDPAARDRLVGRLAGLPALIRAKHRRLGSPLQPTQLDDVAQNVLLALWEKLPAFDGRVPLPAWSVGFASLEILKVVGKMSRSRERTGDLPDVVDPAQLATLEATDRLASLLQHLAPQDLEILRQKHIEGRTFPEIAAACGCPPASVKTRYYRALQALRRRSQPEGKLT